MAPLDSLSPPGSSQYSSDTMYVGDGTWDATKNDFLLPNLMGLNFETMRYNGMGNRFATMPGYHGLIKGHGVLAVITFLFIVPAAIFIARFYSRSSAWALRLHIYLQILTVGLSTVVFILGWFAVGPSRSLTNPHHGIGLAIYVMVLFQALGGWWVHGRSKGRVRRRPRFTAYLHQWLGRCTALLAIAQIPLGLCLYGSPKFTFVLYAIWMSFLVLLYFIFSYRATAVIDGHIRQTSHGTVIPEERKSRFGWFGPLAAGAGAAALLGRHRRNRSVSPSRRDEVVSTRRNSESFVEKQRHDDHEDGGMMSKLFKGAAVLGAGAMAKSWWDGRRRRKDGDDYSSVSQESPRKLRKRRDDLSEISDSTISTNITRMEEGRRPGGGAPIAAAAAGAAAGAAVAGAASHRPVTPTTPRPARSNTTRQHSFDSGSYSYSYSYDSTVSPSRRAQETHGARNGLMAGLGLGWISKRMKDRRDKKEQDRVNKMEEERIEEARKARRGSHGARYTGDGNPSTRRGSTRASQSQVQPSELSATTAPSTIIPIATSAAAGAAMGSAMAQSHSRQDIINPAQPHSRQDVVNPMQSSQNTIPAPSRSRQDIINQSRQDTINQSRQDIINQSRQDIIEPAIMPDLPHDPHGILHQDSGSEEYASQGGGIHRRPSERRRREGEAAAAAAVAAAEAVAASEERRRRRNRSRTDSQGLTSPAVSLKVKTHGDKSGNVTLRRLTEAEAAAERNARQGSTSRRRADSISSLSGTDTAASKRRYRREERRNESAAGSISDRRTVQSASPMPPPIMAPLSPPSPAFAGGKKPKDSAYYSGRPEAGSSQIPGRGSTGSPESHGTWSGMSPSESLEGAAERSRRRRRERNQRQSVSGVGTVDYT